MPAEAGARISPIAEAADAACLERLLRRLGWRIEAGAVEQVRIDGGRPCERASLQEAQAHGDLRIHLPDAATPAQHAEAMHRALADPANLCAYAFELGEATRRATGRLQANDGYRFSAVQLGWIGFGARGANAQGWHGFRSLGRGYRPAHGNAHAIDAFYRGHVRSECGVGRQVAQLATQRELYGDAAFDREFAPAELSIGTFLTLHRTDSILLGAHAGQFLADGKARQTARLGRQAFVGVPGFIEHVFDKTQLDDLHNQAENFVVTEVSAEAAAALAEHGGLAYYDGVNRRIWELSQQMPGYAYRRFERLLYERDARLRAQLPPEQQAVLAQIDALLADPFYRGFMVYVHPKGVKPVGYHVARLLDRNPRTPYSIDLALHNLHTTLYWRWIDRQLQDCAAAAGVRASGAAERSIE
ncbi:MAG TPA: hypothetical protein DDZ67_09815 [Xanthomonadaceae bacterium]|nr:hypothetical protein [Xanthomonadaceae bacterium]